MTNETAAISLFTPVAGTGCGQGQTAADSPGRALVAAPHSWEPKHPHCHAASALVWGAVATALPHQCRGLAHHEPTRG